MFVKLETNDHKSKEEQREGWRMNITIYRVVALWNFIWYLYYFVIVILHKQCFVKLFLY